MCRRSLLPYPFISLLFLIPGLASGADAVNPLLGAWTGTAQFNASIRTEIRTNLHQVVNIALLVDKAGRVQGLLEDASCSLQGLASPGAVQTVLNVDVNVSGCRQGEMNRRYKGSLAYYTASSTGVLTLRAFTVQRVLNAQYEIEATIRRH